MNRAIRIAALAAFACFTLEAIVIALVYLAIGQGMISWLDQQQVFPLIGTSTPLDAAVISSLAVGVGLGSVLDTSARWRR
jgi:hypothetical protein